MSVDGDVDDCGHEFPAHYKVMLDKLNEQRQLDQFTDITLIVDGKIAWQYICHFYDFLQNVVWVNIWWC